MRPLLFKSSLNIHFLPMRRLFFLVFVCLLATAKAQVPFSLEWEELTWPQIPAIHSFACAQHDGKWLFIGGRSNGLHGFLPPLAFPNSGKNNDIIVFDPTTGQRWDQPTSALPDSLREPLTSSNMQFHQTGTKLYMLGGYGWSTPHNTFTTFPTLTAIHIPGLMDAVINTTSIEPYFTQIRDTAFAVCGAHLGLLDSTYILAFGHFFHGIYDRSDTTGFHTQIYTYGIRRFQIQDNGPTLSVQHLPDAIDSAHYRRRDYNLVPQVMPDGSLGYTGYAGVFQKGINMPYTFPVDVLSTTDSVVTTFHQNLAHYHCGVLPLYDSLTQHMYTVFFGGEAMYDIDSAGNMRYDSLVPFVKTVSIVERDPNGLWTEHALATQLPAYLGTNAQFFPYLPNLRLTENGVGLLHPLQGRTLVGHLMGGIESPDRHINLTDPALSNASTRVFAIYIDTSPTAITTQAVDAPFSWTASPNPTNHECQIKLYSTSLQPVHIDLLDLWGNHVQCILDHPAAQQESFIHFNTTHLPQGQYYLRTSTPSYHQTLKLQVLH